MKLNAFIKSTKKTLIKHSPEILHGLAIAGAITGAVLMVPSTIKALDLIEEEKQTRSEEEDVRIEQAILTKKEIVKTTWKCYIPSALLLATSTACIILGDKTTTKRTTALAAAYKLSEVALQDYKDAVVETIGEEKARVVKEKAAQKKVDRTKNDEVYILGDGKVWFFEPISYRYFQSEVADVKNAIANLNYRMTSGMEETITLKEFYDEIGLKYSIDTPDIGWGLYKEGLIKIDFVATTMENGNPCLMLDYETQPSA